jgi:hypothetical protein
MTSVLEAMEALRSEERRAAPSAVTVPAASEEAVRLALHLRDLASNDGGRIVLFVPASRQGNPAPAAADAARGLLELRDGPVVIVDLRAEPDGPGTPEWLTGLIDDDEARLMWGAAAAGRSASRWRPLAGRNDGVSYASSPQFAARLDDVRARYPYVVCIGEAIPRSVATLIVAGMADGVVLSVLTGRTTRSEMHEVTTQLRRARATLLGFVVDPRGAQRGGER